MNDIEFTICEIKNYAHGSMNSICAKGCNLAIEALEKQIPKKTTRIKQTCHETDGCSICRTEFYNKYKYCPECGQKLDWSGEDE